MAATEGPAIHPPRLRQVGAPGSASSHVLLLTPCANNCNRPSAWSMSAGGPENASSAGAGTKLNPTPEKLAGSGWWAYRTVPLSAA
jgi:hypothetical protein